MSSKEPPSELIRAKDLKAFDLWTLPSFDPEVEAPEPVEAPPGDDTAVQGVDPAAVESEDVALEDVKPLTLDELEAIRQDAYNEGFATGEKDGFHAGQLKAKQEADMALAVKIAGLEQLMTQLFEPIAAQDQQLEEAMVTLLGQMVRQVIQRELVSDSSQIRQVLSEALKLLPMGTSNIRIHVNPQDFELIKVLRERHEENWRILEDASLLPGGCRVESELSRIDATVETRLNQALKQLFAQQREHAAHPLEADLLMDLEASPAIDQASQDAS
ncbi:flagellar assembly protein FliH [Pseudomonas sp. HMWF032]|uniref:flagellar assembly protein FliH n=1 Tax=unclassified Pseudomonas TaxID=196821 RepID=UPI000D38AF60|nr:MULTISPECIES: flagellar assembly protein FliH [unclassified Pseudomonas]PTS82736.1 flagellar assembly protein FliH [Pseudomonas sp. HMWF032]PTT72827.1 flagellar assembly protein FliH [Pseudomonas sp. HMWF010]WAC43610.1 flagellar assembly protein FliH [Pseudomonas sp. SL4(2022)]